MKISELKTRIADTLNLDIITLSSLVTCVNNCFADIQSRGYREFTETTITTDKDSNALVDMPIPLSIALPTDFRRISYLKVETENNWHDSLRINLFSSSYKGAKDPDGTERIQFHGIPYAFAYYILNNNLILDSALIGFPIKSVALGYHKKLERVDPSEASLDTEIDIRDDLADALVLYGIYFYATRSSLDPELSKEMLNRYRYFCEDILSNLYAEDRYSQNSNIRITHEF